MNTITVTALGGPTAIIEIGGLRLLTDPTFDPAGSYPIGSRALTKTAAAALGPDDLGRIDAVLLSHDQHPDNLDHLGREFLARVPTVLTTGSAANRIPGTTALPSWQTTTLTAANATLVRVTAVPAQHGPDSAEHLVGEVTGFVLSVGTVGTVGDGLDVGNGVEGVDGGGPVVYVSGDNASLEVVGRVAERFPDIDVAILFAGAAQTPLVDGYLTLTSRQAAQAAQILGASQVVPLHYDSWAHFTEGADELTRAFEDAELTCRLNLLAPGEHAILRAAHQPAQTRTQTLPSDLWLDNVDECAR